MFVLSLMDGSEIAVRQSDVDSIEQFVENLNSDKGAEWYLSNSGAIRISSIIRVTYSKELED